MTTDETAASLRPETPDGMDAVGALLELARAFSPNFDLPQLAATPPIASEDGSTEDRIRQAEARYQTLVEQIPAVTFMASFENGLSEIYVSPHIETMLGYTAAEWIENPILWYQRLHPDDKSRWNEEFSRTVSWAEPFKADYRFLAKDGRVVWIHGEAKVVRDEKGQPSFVQGIGYDITELKEAEEVLRRSREELEALVEARTAELALSLSMMHATLDSTTDAIVATDLSGNVRNFNEKYAQMMEVTREQLNTADLRELRKKFSQRFKNPEQFMSRVMEIYATAPAESFETLELKDETILERYSKIQSIDERPVGRVWSFRDVTERKRAEEKLHAAKEEADRANRAKSEFLSRMSHELRTPLNAILGFGQILEGDLTDPDHLESIQQVLKGGRHLLGLINEVLDIASIEAGRMAVSIEPVPAGEIMEEVIELVRPLAAARNIQIRAPSGDWNILADQKRIKQVFLNLLSNAIKYNREAGEVVVEVERREDNRVRIKITDTGPGISAEDVTKIFTPFERLRAGDTKVEGTGLGLAVCQRLVELMGGIIGIDSRVGEGSTFWVEFPEVGDLSAKSQPARKSPLVESRFALRECSILYIEDHLSNLTLLQRIMERHSKIKFLTATNGTDGLKIARENHPDLILLDLYLPDISGEEVLEQLRRTSETAKIPVLMISADATRGQAERLLAAGAQGYLTKPLNVPKFLEAINLVLEGKSTVI